VPVDGSLLEISNLVRVIFECKLAIGLFDILIAFVFIYFKYLISPIGGRMNMLFREPISAWLIPRSTAICSS